jgi:hypothetical protein
MQNDCKGFIVDIKTSWIKKNKNKEGGRKFVERMSDISF